MVVAGVVGLASDVGSAALARLTGGGYSGVLSSNKKIRNQQLTCDPATQGVTEGEGESGIPISGSTSVLYDPSLVTLSGLTFGPGYVGSGLVELRDPPPPGAPAPAHPLFFEPVDRFLKNPKVGIQTGYVQVNYKLTGSAGLMSVPAGFATVDSNGVQGVDTHALTFSYLPGVPDGTQATYQIYADTGKRPSGNRPDSLTALGPDGKPFTLGPSQLSPATVSGSLNTATVPLPPALWTGLATLAALAAGVAWRRRVACSP